MAGLAEAGEVSSHHHRVRRAALAGCHSRVGVRGEKRWRRLDTRATFEREADL